MYQNRSFPLKAPTACNWDTIWTEENIENEVSSLHVILIGMIAVRSVCRKTDESNDVKATNVTQTIGRYTT